MKNVQGRTMWYASLFVLGAVLFVLAEFMNVIDDFWSGMGLGFVLISAIRLVQLGRYKNDPAYAKKITVKNNDERNQYLSSRARSSSFSYSIILEGVVVIALHVLGMPEMGQIVAMVLCGQLVLYWGSYFLLRSKY